MHAVHILLVDDEERFAQNLSKLLNTRGFSTRTALSGPQALERLGEDASIGVVVLDVRMPGMNGLETLTHIKQDYPGISVIMLTGQATLEDGVAALRRGAFDYIQKPFDIEELDAKIRMALSVEGIRRHPILWPRSTAGDIIRSDFLPLLPDDPLDRALTIFNHYHHGEGARTLLVVDGRRHIQGMIDRSQLLAAATKAKNTETIDWEWLRGHPEHLPRLPVSSIMNRRVFTVTADTALTTAARLMLRHHYDSMPVVTENTLLGIIRLQDVLRCLPADENEASDG